MSLVIKGMEMPENCCDCPLFKSNANGYLFCKGKRIAFGKEDYWWLPKQRPDWCPLRSLPEKHGRLVDIGAIEDEYSLVHTDMRGFKLEPLDMVDSSIIFKFKPWKEVETIIEAEGEE